MPLGLFDKPDDILNTTKKDLLSTYKRGLGNYFHRFKDVDLDYLIREINSLPKNANYFENLRALYSIIYKAHTLMKQSGRYNEITLKSFNPTTL